MYKKFKYATCAALILGAAATANAGFLVSIDQTGANNPVSSASGRAWNFGITDAGAAYIAANNVTFDGGFFELKDFSGTTAPIVFSVYSGLGGNVNGNTLLFSVSHTPDQFSGQYSGNPGNTFLFGSALTLTAGYYSATLTTTAPDVSNQEYFLKEGSLIIQGLDSQYWLADSGTGTATTTFNSVTPVPEPSTWWGLAASVVGVAGIAFRRKA
jgi:hypothetical protein